MEDEREAPPIRRIPYTQERVTAHPDPACVCGGDLSEHSDDLARCYHCEECRQFEEAT